MDRSLPEELIPSAVDGLGGSPLRVEDEVVGRIVSVIRPPGDLPRRVEWKPDGGSLGPLKHLGICFSPAGEGLIFVPSEESLHSVEVVSCFAGSRQGNRGSGDE